ncbi:MAG: hypothetical protein C4581_00140 [Nitrospiraceae bacterium]|nr:MAG: hypothetical protein C4581_00140 [Nitrospiraceae bacterium]
MNKEEYQELREKVVNTAIWISTLPENQQREFLKILAGSLSQEKREKLHSILTNLVYTEERWKRFETWMEARYKKNPGLLPKQMAAMCMSLLKIKTTMAPKMITIAQKVKDRLRKQRDYKLMTLHNTAATIDKEEELQ